MFVTHNTTHIHLGELVHTTPWSFLNSVPSSPSPLYPSPLANTESTSLFPTTSLLFCPLFISGFLIVEKSCDILSKNVITGCLTAHILTNGPAIPGPGCPHVFYHAVSHTPLLHQWKRIYSLDDRPSCSHGRPKNIIAQARADTQSFSSKKAVQDWSKRKSNFNGFFSLRKESFFILLTIC